MHYAVNFLAGMLLCNALLHLAAGLQGQPFPTPFAKPRGVADSAPWLNVIWGMFNLVGGVWLLASSPVTVGATPEFAVIVAGAFVMGLYVARHFARVRAARK